MCLLGNYVGDFVAGKPQGRGVSVDQADQSFHCGEYKYFHYAQYLKLNDPKHCSFVKSIPWEHLKNFDVMIMSFREGQKCGFGHEQTASGEYEGQYKNDKKVHVYRNYCSMY